MLLTVVAGGLVLLTGIATLIGVIDGRAQRAAWNRIAAGRRELWQWEQDLVVAAERRGCGGCAVLRSRAELLKDT